MSKYTSEQLQVMARRVIDLDGQRDDRTRMFFFVMEEITGLSKPEIWERLEELAT